MRERPRTLPPLRQTAPLVMEAVPSFYVYRLHMGEHTQSGVAACFSVDEYDRDLIRKHEKTRPDKEDDRTRHMLAIEAQTGPVFLTYRATAALDAVITRVESTAPLFDFTAPDQVRHVLWRVPATDMPAIVEGFAAVPVLYIADGHHRAASAARARQALKSKGPGEWDRVMAVAFPDNQMQVLPVQPGGPRPQRPHDRVIPRGLAGAGRRASRRHRPLPKRRGRLRCGLRGSGTPWDSAAPRPSTSTSSSARCWRRCSASPTSAPTPASSSWAASAAPTNWNGWSTPAAAPWRSRCIPVSLADLMRIADAGGIMPPKSTWFEPKLRDGLLSHVIA